MDLSGTRRKAGKIERHAADQRAVIGFLRRRKALAIQPFLDKVVDGVADESGIRRRWDGGALDGLIRPVPFVDSALRDPAADGVFLFRRQHALCATSAA